MSEANRPNDGEVPHPLRSSTIRLSALCLPLICGMTTVIVPEKANGSGFALREQSGAALGNAYAGSTAAAEDLSYMFFNPASLTRQEGHQAAQSLTLIMPTLEPDNIRGTTRNGAPITGNDGGDGGKDALLPALYAMWDVSQSFDLERNIKFGFGVNVPFGLETGYDTDWVGRYHSLDSRLETIAFNPAVAFELVDGISIGGGLIVQYASARLTNALDFATALGNPALSDGRARIGGDDWGFGGNFGVLVEPWQGTRFGAAYRSHIDHELDGDARFRTPAAVAAAFPNTGVSAKLTTPESVSFGAYHDINDKWAIMGEAAWTRWSRFEDLRIKFDSDQPTNFTDEDWESVWFFAAGATYRPSADWTLRVGVAHDQSPVKDRTRTPRVPDSDRTWLAFGVGYQPFASVNFDLGYTHIFMDDASVDLRASDPGNANRGNLSYESRNHIDMITLQATIRF